MSNYRVTWEMDIDEVTTPREAAEKALAYLRDPAAQATCFQVTERVWATEKFAGWQPERNGPDRMVLTGQAIEIDLDGSG